jgi:hypothetical protein
VAETPEAVALDLLHMIARNEGKNIGPDSGQAKANRVWILNTYAECLQVVKPAGTRAPKVAVAKSPKAAPEK